MKENNESEGKSFKLDITSSALEKGLDLAKDFLGKLIGPTIEETGLLLKDHMTMWRFKNQVKMLMKARTICQENNIQPKAVSLKLLVPLIENASLEDDEFLQSKWATLLSNLVDSDKNIENHVFPYLLSQISKTEYLFLEEHYLKDKTRLALLKIEKEEFIRESPSQINKIKDEIEQIKNKLDGLNDPWGVKNSTTYGLATRERELQKELNHLVKHQLHILDRQLHTPITLPEQLKDFEFANLIRLGLVKELYEVNTTIQTIEIENKPEEHYWTVDFEPELESTSEIIFTELGKLFIEACT